MEQGVSYLVEILLPTATNEGEQFGREPFDHVRDELLHRFGGVTLFTRSPAEGLWAPDAGKPPSSDRMITVEVMTEEIDGEWWEHFRHALEQRFRQQEVLIRCYQVRRL